jgi:hypothetical protein
MSVDWTILGSPDLVEIGKVKGMTLCRLNTFPSIQKITVVGASTPGPTEIPIRGLVGEDKTT